MINRMNATGIWINDADKAYDFYVNKLGFTVLQDQKIPGGGRFLMVVPPGGGTALMVVTPMPGVEAQVGGQTPIAWETEDIEATYEELRAKGVEFTQPPTQQFWGGFESSFKDADGNIFKLLQMRK